MDIMFQCAGFAAIVRGTLRLDPKTEAECSKQKKWDYSSKARTTKPSAKAPIVDEAPLSALTSRTMEEIAGEPPITKRR